MVNGESVNLIDKAAAGLTCSAGDFTGLSENISKMCKMPSSQLKEMGSNSHNYYKNHFNREMFFEKAESIFYNLV